MEGIENMEGVMAIGVGYVVILTPAIIVFLVLRAQQNALEKRLDSLVQMSRISGEAIGVDEISRSLVNARGKGGLQRWGIILVATALGVCGAGFLGGVEPLLLASIVLGALGFGMLLANRVSAVGEPDELGAATGKALS
jgi:hypothetical protein